MQVFKSYRIQENGQVTLPIKFRQKYNLKKGDAVLFQETEEGLVINPVVTTTKKLLDDIGNALKEKGVSFDEMLESIQKGGQKQARKRYTSEN